MATTDHTALIQRAQNLLAESIGRPLKLINPEELDSQHTVLRCRLYPTLPALPYSVIIKQVTSTEFNNPAERAGESQRFLNEWASLKFLNDLPGDVPCGPQLLAGSRADNLIILEDFGVPPSVQDLLLGNDRDAAEKGLLAIGRFLGQMQVAAHNRKDEFAAAQSRLNTTSPLSDSTLDFRDRLEVFQDCLDTLHVSPAAGFWQALEDLEQSIHTPGPFHTFTHCDAGPHNFLYMNGEVQILDCEFAAFHHGLLDVVSARLGFPQTSKAQSVPLKAAKQLENAYQTEISHAIPQVADGRTFAQAIADACAHWALSRWSGSWTRYFREWFSTGEEAVNKRRNITAVESAIIRPKALTLYHSFIQCARLANRQLALAETLHSYTRALQNEWPDLKVMPVYPALQR